MMSIDPYAEYCRAQALASMQSDPNPASDDDGVDELENVALLLAAGARARTESPVAQPYRMQGQGAGRPGQYYEANEEDGRPTLAPNGARRKAKSSLSSPRPYPPVLHGAAAPETQGRAWDPEEDAQLLAAIERIGFHWKAVAKALESTGRTDAMCRNRYTRIKAPMKAGVECKNRCKRCGQMKRGHTCLTPEEQAAAESGASKDKDKDPQEARKLAQAAASHRAALKLAGIAERQKAERQTQSQNTLEPSSSPPVVVEARCTWVQCDDCEKWRRLWGVDEADLPDSWTCDDHPDASLGRLSCDTPEEEMDDAEEMDAADAAQSLLLNAGHAVHESEPSYSYGEASPSSAAG